MLRATNGVQSDCVKERTGLDNVIYIFFFLQFVHKGSFIFLTQVSDVEKL